MATRAWVNGKTPVDQDNMNALMQMQSHKLIHAGALITEKTGAGVAENTLNTSARAMRFTMAGTELGYVMLELNKYGTGADLVVEIRDASFNPDGSSMGTLVASRTVPKEFLPAASTYFVIPFGLTGLTNGANYWIIANQAGDASNNVDLVGEASQDASHPTYNRNGTSGAWTIQNAIHRKVYDYSVAGDLLAGIYDGVCVKWLEWTAGELTRILRYIPAPDDVDNPGVRDIKTLSWSNGVPREGSVT